MYRLKIKRNDIIKRHKQKNERVRSFFSVSSILEQLSLIILGKWYNYVLNFTLVLFSKYFTPLHISKEKTTYV